MDSHQVNARVAFSTSGTAAAAAAAKAEVGSEGKEAEMGARDDPCNCPHGGKHIRRDHA